MTHAHAAHTVFAATLGVALFAASCGGADSCIQVRCASGASMSIPLAALPASGTVVTVCRNDTCYQATVPEVPGLPDAGEASTRLAFTDAAFVVAILWQGADRSVELQIEWREENSEMLADGDRYLVTLTDVSGATTPLLSQTATYLPVTPVADQCESSAPPCRIAQLHP